MTKPATADPTTADASATWIMTYTGQRFYPFTPKANDVQLADIAHALAMICRFTGHTRQFYSVAQHSVNVSRLAECQAAADRALPYKEGVVAQLALVALLHDAAEAYICDLAQPIKALTPRYEAVETLILHAIHTRLAVETSQRYAWRIKAADLALLHAEARELFSPEARRAAGWDVPDPVDCPPEIIDLCPWTPREAERMFLERYFYLDKRRAPGANPNAERIER